MHKIPAMRTYAHPPFSALSCNRPVGIQRPSALCLLANAFALIFFAMFITASATAADNAWLWQVGQQDHKNTEFALAPNDFNRFSQDGFFLVGASDSQRDWPYVHPGLQDAWAGGRPHPFTILFVLKKTPAPGEWDWKPREWILWSDLWAGLGRALQRLAGLVARLLGLK